MKRKEVFSNVKRIVIKAGTNVLTSRDGKIDRRQIRNLCSEVSEIVRSKCEVVLVSSGAIAAGASALGLKQKPGSIQEEQAAASVGQSRLMHIYNECFNKKNHIVGQVLLTQADLRDRKRYLNARNTIITLLNSGVIPVVNENDAVAVDELYFGNRFGDNDILSALVTNLIGAHVLIILTDVDGLLSEKDGKLIEIVEKITPSVEKHVKQKKSCFGKGGMLSKIRAAGIVTGAGERVVIANGRLQGVLRKILCGENIGTLFLPGKGKIAERKRWIAFTLEPRGILKVDSGAAEALMRGKSLLARGIRNCKGKFRVGEAVDIETESKKSFARGLVNYTSFEVNKIMGVKSGEIESILGYKTYDEVVHRDNMVITVQNKGYLAGDR